MSLFLKIKDGVTGQDRRSALAVSVLLGLAILAAFWRVLTNDFITCDDPDYVINNMPIQNGLTLAGVRWAILTFHSNNWHPLTWLSHMLDCQLYGLNPLGHHLTNLLLHIADAIVLFLLLRRMTGSTWRSALVAALFGLHPMHVQSVAWVSERKDVLSTLFFFLTIWAYARYARSKVESRGLVGGVEGAPRPSQRRVIGFYILALLLFALGLMSKPMVVTLPFVLLLLDYWPLGRFKLDAPSAPGDRAKRWRLAGRLTLEKLPFFALSGAASFLTVIAQRQNGNVATLQALPLDFRLSNAAISYMRYLGKLVWPARLAAHYPYVPGINIAGLAAAALALLAASLAAIALRKRMPYLTVGWFWFLGTLVPVIGIIQVGAQSMADRYSYIPFIGLFVIVSWGVGQITLQRPGLQLPAVTGGCLAVIGCMILSSREVRWWKNTDILFTRAIAVTTNNAPAQMNLGATLAQEGKLDEAWAHLTEALRINPFYAEAQSNLGYVLAQKGKQAEAIPLYRACLERRPDLAQTHYLLGMALLATQQLAEAIQEYRACLAIDPNHILACNDLAWVLATDPSPEIRDVPEAVALAERACRLSKYKEPLFVGTLAAAYAAAGRFDDAVKTGERAKAEALRIGFKPLAERNEELLRLYRNGKPFVEKKDQGKVETGNAP
jgi:tetratricopeptide (TPR) repeat protein